LFFVPVFWILLDFGFCWIFGFCLDFFGMFKWSPMLVVLLVTLNCLFCDRIVRNNQCALQCDGCEGWQHLECGVIPVTAAEYDAAVEDGNDFEWRCGRCPMPGEELEEDEFDIERDNDEEVAVDAVAAEDSLDDEPPNPVVESDDEGHFEKVVGGSNRGKDKLVHTDGYSFTVKRERNGIRYWTCSVRRTGRRCNASVVEERNGDFIVGPQAHIHGADPALLKKVMIVKKAKDAATR
jgi:hypothetical protein